MEPRRLGDYLIQHEIGRGGMGVVYLAEQISLKRTVALKVLAAHLTLSDRHVARFQYEAKAAAKLKHKQWTLSSRVVTQRYPSFRDVLEDLA